MHTIIVDPNLQPLFGNSPEQAKICDPAGRLLGYFVPSLAPERYRGVQSPTSEDELRRRETRTDGRTLREILADLESRQ